MEDLIRRHDAIEALCSVCGNDCNKEQFKYYGPLEGQRILCPEHYALSTLPSAEPERWSTCFDCPLSHGCPVIKGCTNKQAMEYAGEIPDNCPLNKISAQPERKKGEWVPEFNGEFKGGAYWFSCSKCKRIVPEVRNGGWNFCPNCGSYNGGEEE